jgi:hypothetical protein
LVHQTSVQEKTEELVAVVVETVVAVVETVVVETLIPEKIKTVTI